MPRTESKTIQCHPDDEQEVIDTMQIFHWSLLSSQVIDKVDNSLESRGGSTYSVRRTEKYVKLAFSRELDLPNLSEIKKLEAAYLGLVKPRRLFDTPPEWLTTIGGFCVLAAIGCFLLAVFDVMREVLFGTAFFLFGVLLCFSIIFQVVKGMQKPKYERELAEFKKKRQEILAEVEQYQ